jgi:phage gp36-like protein
VTYATLEQLSERFGERMLLQLTDRSTPPAGTIDSGIVDRALADNDAVIDGYVAGRYALPLAEVPPLLADLAQVIAIYKLHPFAPDPKIKDDYTDALKMLDRIASGTVRLPAQGIEPASSGAAGVEVIDRDRDLTPENMRGFI